jgi:hypothetical protein
MSDARLETYFKFDDTDLSANRRGVLSEKQQARFKGNKKLVLAKVQGRANIVEAQSFEANTYRHTPYHELQIGGKRFMATTILADIMQGDEYRVFYIDHSKDRPFDTSYLYASDDILSAELVGKGSDAPVANAASSDTVNDPEIIEKIKTGDILGAVKAHRAIYNSNFEEAKKAVEILKAELGL